MADPASLSARGAAEEIAAGRLTSEALTRAYLDRIAAREEIVHAWQYLDSEQALAEARQRDREPPRGRVKPLADSLDTVGVMARDVADAAFFAGILAGRPALRQVAMPTVPPRFGLYRTPMWDQAESSTADALDRAQKAVERFGATVTEIAAPAEHKALNAAHDAIMGFELAASLAYERTRHAAQVSPRLGQLLDAGMTVTAEAYDTAVAETA